MEKWSIPGSSLTLSHTASCQPVKVMDEVVPEANSFGAM